MHLQAALCQANLQLRLKRLSFLLVTAVHQSIVRIPTPREVRVFPRHPEIKRIVEKKIRQDWADHTTLRGSAVSLNCGSIFLHHGRLKPSFDVQKGPLALDMLPDGPQQKLVVDVVEQAFDVKL
jgi:hypothetical protein